MRGSCRRIILNWKRLLNFISTIRHLQDMSQILILSQLPVPYRSPLSRLHFCWWRKKPWVQYRGTLDMDWTSDHPILWPCRKLLQLFSTLKLLMCTQSLFAITLKFTWKTTNPLMWTYKYHFCWWTTAMGRHCTTCSAVETNRSCQRSLQICTRQSQPQPWRFAQMQRYLLPSSK